MYEYPESLVFLCSMSKVLIIGPNYYNFLPAMSEAFSDLGWEPLLLPYDNPIHPYTAWMKWRYKLSRHRDVLQEKSRSAFREEVMARFDSFRPELVFVLNGDILDERTLDAFRLAGAKVALWLFDNREWLPRSASQAGHVDHLFCFDRQDVEWFRRQEGSAPVSFLPQACDTTIYRPLPGSRKDIDILFVGNLLHSPKRKETLLSVIRSFPDRRIVVYGLYQPWYKGVAAWLCRPYKSVFKNRNIPPQKVNELYNRSRVVLNIHQELQRDGANPRVFEICGSGAYQICDANGYVRSLFSPGSVAFYESVPELVSLIREALDGDKCPQASDAHQTVYTYHTFLSRMQAVLAAFPELN